jgi:hypothetical protein
MYSYFIFFNCSKIEKREEKIKESVHFFSVQSVLVSVVVSILYNRKTPSFFILTFFSHGNGVYPFSYIAQYIK